MKDVKGFHIEESKLNPGQMILVCVAEDDQKYVVSGDHWNPSVLQPYSNNENGKTALRNYQMPLEKQQSVGRMEREPKDVIVKVGVESSVKTFNDFIPDGFALTGTEWIVVRKAAKEYSEYLVNECVKIDRDMVINSSPLTHEWDRDGVCEIASLDEFTIRNLPLPFPQSK